MQLIHRINANGPVAITSRWEDENFRIYFYKPQNRKDSFPLLCIYKKLGIAYAANETGTNAIGRALNKCVREAIADEVLSDEMAIDWLECQDFLQKIRGL